MLIYTTITVMVILPGVTDLIEVRLYHALKTLEVLRHFYVSTVVTTKMRRFLKNVKHRYLSYTHLHIGKSGSKCDSRTLRNPIAHRIMLIYRFLPRRCNYIFCTAFLQIPMEDLLKIEFYSTISFHPAL